jgi:hypothetical protein
LLLPNAVISKVVSFVLTICVQWINLYRYATALVHSCAVVGHGVGLAGARLQTRVDGHHLIARVNNAPSMGYEAGGCTSSPIQLTRSALRVAWFQPLSR